MRYQRQIQAVRQRGRRNAHRYPTAKDKTARAFAAYVDLCEAADWIEREIHEEYRIEFTGRDYEPLLLREGRICGVNLREEVAK